VSPCECGRRPRPRALIVAASLGSPAPGSSTWPAVYTRTRDADSRAGLNRRPVGPQGGAPGRPARSQELSGLRHPSGPPALGEPHPVVAHLQLLIFGARRSQVRASSLSGGAPAKLGQSLGCRRLERGRALDELVEAQRVRAAVERVYSIAWRGSASSTRAAAPGKSASARTARGSPTGSRPNASDCAGLVREAHDHVDRNQQAQVTGRGREVLPWARGLEHLIAERHLDDLAWVLRVVLEPLRTEVTARAHLRPAPRPARLAANGLRWPGVISAPCGRRTASATACAACPTRRHSRAARRSPRRSSAGTASRF